MTHYLITLSAAAFVLSSCVSHQPDYAYPQQARPARPVLPRHYPRYDPEADNPPYYRNEPVYRPPADYYRDAYPYYDPDADNPPFQGQGRDPQAPKDGFARPLFD